MKRKLIDKLQSLGFISRQPEQTKSKDEIIISWGKSTEKLSEQELDAMLKGHIRDYLQNANKEELIAILEGCKDSGEDKEVLER